LTVGGDFGLTVAVDVSDIGLYGVILGVGLTVGLGVTVTLGVGLTGGFGVTVGLGVAFTGGFGLGEVRVFIPP
jgi:hypothetical protein